MQYTVTVKRDQDAFAAIRRFDPEAVVELDNGCGDVEFYTITSYADLHHLLDAAPGLVEWDDVPGHYNCDFPPEDPEPPDAQTKFQDWDCWQHPSTGFQEAKRLPKTINKISDYALTKLIDDNNPIAAAEWRRRYPKGPNSRAGTKMWARGYDEKASAI